MNEANVCFVLVVSVGTFADNAVHSFSEMDFCIARMKYLAPML